jgi:beta-lactamase superfamily II metal-dependent hydrolase
MTDKLTVRIYNVRFGDAILVTVPDRDPDSGVTTKRRILIDVGNAPKVAGSGEGGEDEVFEPVIASILNELGGKPLDLYVMTHEHLDHVQGLFYAAKKLPALDFANRFKVNRLWLTASAHPDYYDEDKHPNARKKKLEFMAMFQRLQAFLSLNPAAAMHGLAELLNNNDPTKTGQCVEFLRQLNPAKTVFVHREIKKQDLKHPFKEAKFEIWAPEEDTSDYYGNFQSLDVGAVPAPVATDRSTSASPAAPAATPPSGVDLGAFLRLLDARRGGIADNLLAIDKAANNTSVVFSLEWRGWRLLFAGDAEIRSWKTMARENVLKPVHFLKVSHHGSHNGTPADDIFDAILPQAPPDNRNRSAAISTWTETYSGIPHQPTNDRLSSRASLHSTLDNTSQLFYEIDFPD